MLFTAFFISFVKTVGTVIFFNRQNSNVIRCYALKDNVFKCGTSNEDFKKAM